MANDFSVCISTVGQGVWQSPDGGESWKRMTKPFPQETKSRALVLHPTQPHTVYAGADTGLYRSEDNGATWEWLSSADGRLNIWALAIDPNDTNTIFAGTTPSGMYRSRDGGFEWEKLPVEMSEECAIGTPRVTTTVVDPDDSRIVWAGVEIDGVHRSLDGGDSWARIEGGLYDQDIHGMAIARGASNRILTATPREIFSSTDVGESWQPLEIMQKFPDSYCRWATFKIDDPKVIFAACGDTALGSSGNLQRSLDGGQNWKTMPIPGEPNSPLMNFGMNEANPNRVFTFSIFGQVYASEDAGDTWTKIKREFTEIRSITWQPN